MVAGPRTPLTDPTLGRTIQLRAFLYDVVQNLEYSYAPMVMVFGGVPMRDGGQVPRGSAQRWMRMELLQRSGRT